MLNFIDKYLRFFTSVEFILIKSVIIKSTTCCARIKNRENPFLDYEDDIDDIKI